MSSSLFVVARSWTGASAAALLLCWCVAGCSDSDDGGSGSSDDQSSSRTDRGGRVDRDTTVSETNEEDVDDSDEGGQDTFTVADETDRGRVDTGPSLPPLGTECNDNQPCEENLVCLDGFCRSRECAGAVSSRSYLGCDYLATDLPNLAYSTSGGTPDSPLGVVLANSSSTDPAPVWVNDANGNPANLVGEVTIAVPAISGLPAITPVTVYSMLTDSTGAAVNQGIGSAQNLDIPAGGMAVMLLPHHGYVTESRVSRQAYQIRTERPVAAYQFGPYCCNYSFTNDASLLLPVATFGTEYRFIGVPSWDLADDPLRGEVTGTGATLTVIGSRPATEVTVTLQPGASVRADPGGRITINGSQATALLGQAEVMHLFSGPAVERGDSRPLGVDLTGARISASAPVAVFSGHECTFYPQDEAACDHLEEQLFPVDTWGTEFALVPPVLRTRAPARASEAIFWKFVADRDSSVVTFSVPFADLSPRQPGFDGVPFCGDLVTDGSSMTLNAGEFCEFGTRDPVSVTSTQPLQVMGIISGQDSTGVAVNAFGQHAGDPAVFLVPPLGQYRLDYQFMAPTTYFSDFVTVIVPLDAQLTLDGDVVDLRTGTAVPGQNLVYRHLPIEDGPHELRSTREFGIQVFSRPVTVD